MANTYSKMEGWIGMAGGIWVGIREVRGGVEETRDEVG